MTLRPEVERVRARGVLWTWLKDLVTVFGQDENRKFSPVRPGGVFKKKKHFYLHRLNITIVWSWSSSKPNTYLIYRICSSYITNYDNIAVIHRTL